MQTNKHGPPQSGTASRSRLVFAVLAAVAGKFAGGDLRCSAAIRFLDKPPLYVRALLYDYRFSSPWKKKKPQARGGCGSRREFIIPRQLFSAMSSLQESRLNVSTLSRYDFPVP